MASFFLLSFVLLGKSIPLSLFLAALGGLAGGYLVAGWKSTELPSLPAQTSESDREGRIALARERSQPRPKQQHRQHRSLWFSWKNSSSSKRRR